MIAEVTPDRRNARAATAILCVALAGLSGCRLTEVWSGARVSLDGRSVQLVAKTSLCSCIVFNNRTDQPVYLESGIGDADTGDAVMPPGSILRQRFDWAGTKPEHFYTVRAWTAQGTPLHFGSQVSFTIAPWEDCAKAACEFAPMMMNAGQSGRVPGDR